ncbi:MAG TPA: hypothetical protein VHE35_25170 [Kofleriaceae bacterium]|nr:hypothetical protein [Kofleriaceae bacterium]
MTVLSILLLSSSAWAGDATGRVREISARIDAAARRVEPLPADAAGTEQLAAELARTAADARAALTPDLRVVSQYRDVADDADHLARMAAALRLAWPCEDGIRAAHELAVQAQRPADDQLAALTAACKAFTSAAAGTHLEHAANLLDGERRALGKELAAAEQRKRAADTVAAAGAARAAELASTVMGRFPDFTDADASDPAKIAEAFAKAPAELVHTMKLGGTAVCDHGEGKTITAAWIHNGESSGLQMYGEPYRDGTGVPVLVWSRHGGRLVVVTLDGRRLEVEDAKELVQGIPPRESWPTAPRDTCLNDQAVDALGPAPAELTKARDEAQACAHKVWQGGEAAFAANDRANLTASTRANRYSALLDRYRAKVEHTCEKQRRAYEAAMLAVIRAHAAPREQALAAATAALAAK